MTALTALPLAGRRSQAADRLWLYAAVALAAMPLAMSFAHRSSPLVITLAGAFAVLAAAAEGRGAELARGARAALATPVGIAALAFLAWSAVSIAWSHAPGRGLYALGEFVLPAGAALVLALSLPSRAPRHAPWLLAACMTLACAEILVELGTGLALRREMGMRSASFIFNRPALTLLVLLAPLLWSLSRRGRPGMAAAGALALLAVLTIDRADSGAAALGLLVAGLAFLLARVLPRTALMLAACGFVLVAALAPVLGDLAQRVLPPALHERLADSHSRERVEIWRSFGAAARARPLAGAGFGTSAGLDRDPVAAQVPPDLRPQLDMGHPHNAAIQVWVELGAVGAVLALAAALLMLRTLAALPAARLAPRFALVAAASAVSLVGHGAWQGWWPAAIGAAVVWFRMADEEGRVR